MNEEKLQRRVNKCYWWCTFWAAINCNVLRLGSKSITEFGKTEELTLLNFAWKEAMLE